MCKGRGHALLTSPLKTRRAPGRQIVCGPLSLGIPEKLAPPTQKGSRKGCIRNELSSPFASLHLSNPRILQFLKTVCVGLLVPLTSPSGSSCAILEMLQEASVPRRAGRALLPAWASHPVLKGGGPESQWRVMGASLRSFVSGSYLRLFSGTQSPEGHRLWVPPTSWKCPVSSRSLARIRALAHCAQAPRAGCRGGVLVRGEGQMSVGPSIGDLGVDT